MAHHQCSYIAHGSHRHRNRHHILYRNTTYISMYLSDTTVSNGCTNITYLPGSGRHGNQVYKCRCLLGDRKRESFPANIHIPPSNPHHGSIWDMLMWRNTILMDLKITERRWVTIFDCNILNTYAGGRICRIFRVCKDNPHTDDGSVHYWGSYTSSDRTSRRNPADNLMTSHGTSVKFLSGFPQSALYHNKKCQ